ncbi:hypothetical protein IEC_01681 [Bacillus toyonensis]|nr:hypothetical protein IEC_01681 [Bacillus toyonensis]MDF9890156.1 hypothetical protein [Bacillus sp. LEw-kw-24]MDH6560608.1 hypothetical protein [Bacillus sp. LEw-kw-2]MDH8704928.1 hypothetical protein [Stenotrophomonas sp. 1198]EJQ82065.1 hypothetical protein IGK_01695 [Bacillus toyonensis]
MSKIKRSMRINHINQTILFMVFFKVQKLCVNLTLEMSYLYVV